MMEFEHYPTWKARNQKNKTPENPVKEACYKWLDLYRIPWNRQNSGKVQVINAHSKKPYWMQLAKKGSGDIVGLVPPRGRFYEVETKAPGKGLNPDQKLRKREVEIAGGIYIKANSIDDLAPLLIEMKQL